MNNELVTVHHCGRCLQKVPTVSIRVLWYILWVLGQAHCSETHYWCLHRHNSMLQWKIWCIRTSVISEQTWGGTDLLKANRYNRDLKDLCMFHCGPVENEQWILKSTWHILLLLKLTDAPYWCHYDSVKMFLFISYCMCKCNICSVSTCWFVRLSRPIRSQTNHDSL